MSRLAAVILSAGLSSRMGSFKPLLPLGSGTVLSQCIHLFEDTGIDPVLVVTGKRNNDVAEVVKKSGGMPVHNRNYEQGMYSSVLTGVKAIPKNVTAFFILPVDTPLVRHESVLQLVKEFETHRPSVLYPRFLGERGHPPLISTALIPDIINHDGTGGLRNVLSGYDSTALDLDMPDIGTVFDLDMPEDYSWAQSLMDNNGPTVGESRQLWEMYNVHSRIVRHCKAVANVAELLSTRINAVNYTSQLDTVLVRGAALTHDIGKGQKKHGQEGARILRTHGFHAAADIVAEHDDLCLGPNDPITEKEVVFLADKLVRRTTPVHLEDRYLEKLDLYGHDSEAKLAIHGRLERARNILTRFDQEVGASCEKLAQEALS